MVLTQLQLKWPNHSTQLLSGLKYLFKNEQLVDCTLKCNKHTLKVHRSVLAACSPYFERELENNPQIVIKDMHFNVLQALIEFMYYGETRITEENFTSLIEAAKLFEVKGLSEMDLLSAGENNVVPSVVTVNKSCTVENSFIQENMNDDFEDNLQNMNSVKSLDEGISANVPNQCLSDGDDSNSNLMGESNASQSHSNRDFVITPPQTESAQILLSLAACSYSQKQYLNVGPNEGAVVVDELQNGGDERLIDQHHHNLLFDESPFVLSDTITSSSSEPHSIVIDSTALPNSSLPRSMVAANSLTAVDFIDTSSATDRGTKPNGVNGSVAELREPQSAPESLLAKLLTRDNQNATKRNGNGNIGSARYETLYSVVEPAAIRIPDKNVARVAVATTTFSQSSPMPAAAPTISGGVDLQPGIILDCPFLIETNGGYVDLSVENMLNVLDNDLFPSHGKNTVKVIPKEEVVPLEASHCSGVAMADASSGVVSLLPPLHIEEQPISEAVLERIQQDTVDELRDDPEAVVLTRVTANGHLETFVLSSADVKALQRMNAERRKRRQLEGDDGASPATPSATHVDVESPLSSGNGDASASLITRIVQFGTPVNNAISKLPFKRSSRPPSSMSSDSNGVPTASAIGSNGNCAAAGETLLAEAAFDEPHRSQPHSHHQPDHHHENMFEELDNQFNMDCSMEIQRDYVAYEEASKNETQLEHNYYANALKDEDEECVAAGENYMMLLEQPLTNGNGLSDKGKSGSASFHRHIIGATDVYLNNVTGEKKEMVSSSRHNGLVVAASAACVSSTTASNGGDDDKLFNGKADLVVKKDALMSSVMVPSLAASAASRRLANGKPTAKSRVVGRAGAANVAVASTSGEFGVNTLPFKSVKNASGEKKPRKTYKRKAAGSATFRKKKEASSLNGGLPFVDANLVEEIVVDEIS